MPTLETDGDFLSSEDYMHDEPYDGGLTTVYIDIETCGPKESISIKMRERLISTIKAPGNYKKIEAIEKYKATKLEEKMDKLATDVSLAEILCISIQTNTGEEAFFSRWDNPDALESTDYGTLSRFAEWVRDQETKHRVLIFAGMGIKRFDLPIIRTRLIYWDEAHLARNLYFRKYETDRVMDLEDDYYWPGSQYGAFPSLEKICLVLEIPIDASFKGKDVGTAWLMGSYGIIEAHCRDDVRATKDIFYKLGHT